MASTRARIRWKPTLRGVPLSPRTVNKHLEQMFEKPGVENRTSATALAVRTLQG
jgi:ATP/maltotriose-dependent transcriptional regulator MalT